MTIGVLHEPSPETRVSLLPEHISKLTAKGIKVLVQHDAGSKAFANDDAYMAVGAKPANHFEILATADIILGMHGYHTHEWKRGIYIGQYNALWHAELMHTLASQSITVFSLDMLPRTTRAQNMDVLSSQANIAGYKAALLAAQMLPRYFPMFMTAAGSIPPAKVVIIGAGVAGLQAIATARRLGAIVEVSDTRAAVKEEVESLGAKFIEVEGAADASMAGGYAVEQSDDFKQRQQDRLAASIAKADVVICTAAIPGKKAPVIVTRQMIHAMKPGSVIIDLAASSGGNTEVTENNQTVVYHYVTILGDSHLAAHMPQDASRLYGKNVLNFLDLLITANGELEINLADELIAGSLICKDGQLLHQRLL